MEEQELKEQEIIEKQSFWKKLITTIKTKVFIINLVVSIAVVAFLFTATFYWLDIITHHGESLSVPDFTGMSMEQVKKVAADRNLEFKIVDSVYDAPGKKGTVIAQTPPAGFKVKEGRTILLTTKTYEPKRILMPDFTGVSLIQAKADMETYGLKLGKLKYIPDIATNNVLEQMYKGKPIAPGTFIESGAAIDLVLGLGQSDKATLVPDFIGLNKEQAAQTCLENSLSMGVLIYDESVVSSADSVDAMVWKQSPAKDSRLTIGSPVDLWLTLDMNKIDANR
ncbi:MAG: PASTA domain-containing protein [Bacteroidales bacterium]|nr:PASTA domain-containing protein [Bacteroidales bacterium]